jgi:hypothetical protein
MKFWLKMVSTARSRRLASALAQDATQKTDARETMARKKRPHSTTASLQETCVPTAHTTKKYFRISSSLTRSQSPASAATTGLTHPTDILPCQGPPRALRDRHQRQKEALRNPARNALLRFKLSHLRCFTTLLSRLHLIIPSKMLFTRQSSLT